MQTPQRKQRGATVRVPLRKTATALIGVEGVVRAAPSRSRPVAAGVEWTAKACRRKLMAAVQESNVRHKKAAAAFRTPRRPHHLVPPPPVQG